MVRDQVQGYRRSIRLKGYDYTQAGAYFVTLCARDRACVFGTVVGGEMRLNAYGRKVADCWLWLAEQYPYVVLDEWVVMPNHLHGIIVITDDLDVDGLDAGGVGRGGSDGGRGGSRTAPTGPRGISTGQRDTSTGPHNIPMGAVGPSSVPTQRKPLGRLIGAFKTVSTRQINDLRATAGAKLWQRNYYEHVIRDDSSLQRIREYIANNPARWALDRERKGAWSEGASLSAPTPPSPGTEHD
jgi:REP element-mobilizing transposase RayT